MTVQCEKQGFTLICFRSILTKNKWLKSGVHLIHFYMFKDSFVKVECCHVVIFMHRESLSNDPRALIEGRNI